MSGSGVRRLGVVVVVAGSAALLARPWFAGLPVGEVPLLVVLFVVLGIVGATWPLPAEPPSDAQPPGPQPPETPLVAALAPGPGHHAAGRAAAVRIGRRDVRSAEQAPIASLPAPRSRGIRPPRWLPSSRSSPSLAAWLVFGVGVGAFGAGRLLAVGTLPGAPLVFRSLVLNSLAAVSEEAFFRRLAYGLAEDRGPALAIGTSAALFAAVHVTVWGWAVLPLDLAAGLVLGWQRWASGGWTVPAATHVVANILAVV